MTDPYFHQPGDRLPQLPQAYQPGYGPAPGPQGYLQPHPGLPPFPGYGQLSAVPVSDKSKVAAGLLQLFLGGYGAGRFYIGSVAIAVVQLLCNLAGWFFFLVGFVTFGIGSVVAFFIWFVLGLWTFIDAILMFTGSVKDGQGRPLRS